MKFKMLTKTRLCACYLIAVRAFYMQMKCIHMCIVYTVSSLMHPAPASQTDPNQEYRMNFPSKVKHTHNIIILFIGIDRRSAAPLWPLHRMLGMIAICLPHMWHFGGLNKCITSDCVTLFVDRIVSHRIA